MRFALAPTLAFVLVTSLGTSPVSAQQPVHNAKAGQPKLLSVYFNCTNRYGLTAMARPGQRGTGRSPPDCRRAIAVAIHGSR